MSLSPRLIAFLLAAVITVLTVTFLSFVPSTTAAMLFVAGVSTFFASFFFVFYTVDILVFREVNQLYETIRKLKIKDFDISRKSLIKSVNPLKKLNSEISVYVEKKLHFFQFVNFLLLFFDIN